MHNELRVPAEALWAAMGIKTATDPETGKVYPIPSGGSGNEPSPDDPPEDDPPADDPADDPPDPAEDSTDWKSEARKWEKRAKNNSDAAARLKKIEDAQKSEAERLADAKAESDKAAETARVEAARLRAAIKHGLEEDDLDLLGSGSDEDIEARAKRFAERIAPPEDDPEPGVSRRPKERLKPGATPSSEPEKSPKEIADSILESSF